MKTLDKHWITAPLIDVEYKQYILLDYLQEVKQHFDKIALYPKLTELINQYCDLILLRDNHMKLMDQFPKRINGIDAEKMTFKFEQNINEEKWVDEIQNIIQMAIPYVQETLAQGRNIYESIEKEIQYETVGLTPMNKMEGYFILNQQHSNKCLVYEYKLKFFESHNDKFRAIHTEFCRYFEKSISFTDYDIKTELIKSNQTLPNPMVYSFYSKQSLPVEATYLPIVSRILTASIEQN